MPRTEKSTYLNRVKRWLIITGTFVIVQLIFMLVDGSSLKPNINDSGNLFARIGRGILESRLFTEWIAPYSFSFFNMFLTVHLAVILILAICEIYSIIKKK